MAIDFIIRISCYLLLEMALHVNECFGRLGAFSEEEIPQKHVATLFFRLNLIGSCLEFQKGDAKLPEVKV